MAKQANRRLLVRTGVRSLLLLPCVPLGAPQPFSGPQLEWVLGQGLGLCKGLFTECANKTQLKVSEDTFLQTSCNARNINLMPSMCQALC